MEFNVAKRDSLIYDFIIKGYSTTDFKATTGTPAASGNNLRLTSAAVASYILYQYGQFEFSINVPTTPSAGEAKHWGLRAPATDNVGAIYFEIAGAVFRVVTKDSLGNTETTTVTWTSYENKQTLFKIFWENGLVHFSIDGTRVATHKTVPTFALPIRMVNGDADNTDVAYISFKEVGSIV